MEQNSKRKLYGFLPWALILAVLAAFSLVLYEYYGGVVNPFETHLKKANLLSTMRIHLLETIEAEKNAVMAITDEESIAFASQARQAADRVESSRKEIEAVIQQGKFPFPRETEMMNEFNSCWSQYKKLDETILDLAVQNTNLKAQRISATQGAQALEHFEESLKALIDRNTHRGQCNKTVTLSYEALTAALKLFALHKPYIEEAEDREMDKIGGIPCGGWLHLWIESRLKNGVINVTGEVFLSAEKVMIISALAMPLADKYSRQVLGLQS
jgi:hypothetical protein